MVLSPQFPDLAALELLLIVARTGSLNMAATEIGITQQAASARITSIEAQTGVVLMSRTARGSTLTAAGTVVAEWAARLLDVAAEVDAGLASLRSDRVSTLRVSASLTIAEQLLPGWLVALNADQARRAQAPVQIVLRATNSDTVVVDVRDGVADVGFVEGPVAPRGLRSRQVGEDRLVVAVRPDHPWARRRTPVTPGEIAATALVTREAGSGTRSAFETALRAVLSDDQALAAPALALSTSAAVRAAVIAGAGPAVLSELALADDLTAGRLKEIAVSDVDLRRTLRAVWVGSKTPPAGATRDLIALAATRTRTGATAGHASRLS
ncbi:MAG: LysR family transcriptional regulator [Actinobacteria bacterium]|nr:LysR family transcriptional regulator [Actinomycetota bacterium]